MKKVNASELLRRYTMGVILIVMIILLAIFANGFFSASNFLGILRSMAITGVAAFGMSLIIIGGEIDLSVGSTIGLSGVIMAYVYKELSAGLMGGTLAVILGILAALVFCGLVGLLNGFIRTKFRIPSFIITLAMLNLLYGISGVLSDGFPISVSSVKWFAWVGAGMLFKSGSFNGIPVAAIWLILAFVAANIVLAKTRFGREIYAVGGNAEAARLSGVNVNKVKILIMVIGQMAAAVSGVIMSSQVLSGSPQFGKGYETNIISTVIIGGTALEGGRGKATGTLLGVFFIGVITNGMTLLGVSDYVKYIVRGALILLAIILNTVQQNKKIKVKA